MREVASTGHDWNAETQVKFLNGFQAALATYPNVSRDNLDKISTKYTRDFMTSASIKEKELQMESDRKFSDLKTELTSVSHHLNKIHQDINLGLKNFKQGSTISKTYQSFQKTLEKAQNNLVKLEESSKKSELNETEYKTIKDSCQKLKANIDKDLGNFNREVRSLRSLEQHITSASQELDKEFN